MRHSPRPKIVALRSPGDLRLAKGGSAYERRFAQNRVRETDPLIDLRWPAGWWILPFGLCGLIEALMLVLWLTGHF